MNSRDTKANIRDLKEELRTLKVMEGTYANTTSHSKLKKDRSDMAKTLSTLDQNALKHRLLNTYVHSY